ncbi:DUF3050 domain-containing protein [Ewingella americana]|uniref:DUF3050 domain-containing protein n=1 Tax=Ewingella americana TaxID=41202 RepID=A0A502GE41_9GAMM|nr:DUF3050 domain-containing protein [Ewingella americana]TPG60011.1 DUF3050 domain-containing protein [Ewingella americana]
MFDETRIIAATKNLVETNPLLAPNAINSLEDLAVFMHSHVFAVWDFMCLAKTVQNHIAPTGTGWKPRNTQLTRFINEMILGEESDQFKLDGVEYTMSHFEMYLAAMQEVINLLPDSSRAHFQSLFNKIPEQIYSMYIWFSMTKDSPFPEDTGISEEARDFMTVTRKFCFSASYVAAAAFAYGRENLIPTMFDKVLDQLTINNLKVPFFKKYLERHIELDGDEHGPMSSKMVDLLCQEHGAHLVDKCYATAEKSALLALEVRANFWLDVNAQIQQYREASGNS